MPEPSEALHLLLIEDNRDDALLLLYELKQAGFNAQHRRVQNAEELQDALQTQTWDAIISDFHLPTFSAPAALQQVQQTQKDIPFIIVSGAIGESTAVEMMRAGAHDYLMKDNLSRLPEALRREIREAHSRAERRQAEAARQMTEERFRLLFERSGDAIFVAQKNTALCLDANQAALTFTGKTLQEILATPLFNIFPNTPPESIRSLLQTPNQGNLPELRIPHPDGNPRWGAPAVIPIQQEIVFFIVHDISATKQKEEAARKHAEEMEALYRTSLEINARTELMPLLQTIVERAACMIQTRMGGIYLTEADGESLKLTVSHQLPAGILGNIVRPGEGLSGKVFQTRQPIAVQDYSTWEGRTPAYQAYPFRRDLGAPMLAKERIIGVINVSDDQNKAAFTPEQIRLLSLFADQAATAIEQARLFNAERSRRREAETLRSATAAISTSLDLPQVLEAILSSIAQVVPYDSATIFLLQGDFLKIVTSRGVPDIQKIIHKDFAAREDALFSQIQREKQTQLVPDVSQDPRFLGWGGTDSYVRSWMGVPLLVRGEVTGYITLDSRQKAAYHAEEAALAQAFANQAAIAIENARLFAETESSLRKINQAYESTIEGWSRAMELRDRETEGHSLRVTALTLTLAQACNTPPQELIHIRRGALLHDIGKMAIPDKILLKPGALTPEEWQVMRQHPQYAYDMLSSVEYLLPALHIPYCHHEKWDGSGYPRGLRGEEIPLHARIFSVIDVWDALTSDRPYRAAWERATVIEHIRQHAGSHFDPHIVQTFLRLCEQNTI